MEFQQQIKHHWCEVPITTEQDVLNSIELFCDEWPDAPFTFGHIVIDDGNLSDHSIKWCLESERIDEWFRFRLSQYGLDSFDPENSSSHSLERWEYDGLISLRDATMKFLKYLLTIPEKVRWG